MLSERGWAHNSQSCVNPTPCLHLCLRPVLLRDDQDSAGDYVSTDTAILLLDFAYGEVRVPFSANRGTVRRNREFESESVRLLETFGALDLSCLDDVVAAPGKRADFLVHSERDAHALCSFTSYAIPQLRALGWKVTVDKEYPWQVIEGDAPWVSSLAPTDTDWFAAQLGIKLGGEVINLLPAILHLLDEVSGKIEKLAAMAHRRVAIPVSPCRYVTIPTDQLLRLLAPIVQLHAGAKTGPTAIEVPASLAGLIETSARLLNDDPQVELPPETAQTQPVPEVFVAQSLRATLRPYQEAGVAWLQKLRRERKGGLLADDMGLGKTLQTIAHLTIEKESGRFHKPTLIVAPTSLVGNWQREIDKFSPLLRAIAYAGANRHKLVDSLKRNDIVITTYPVLLRDLATLAEIGFYYVVLDEAQAIKNQTSMAHSAVMQLRAEHRLALSGTPVENHLDELWSLCEFVNPGALGDNASFRTRYRIPIEEWASKTKMDELRKLVMPTILRRTKDTVASDLPAKTDIIVPIELPGVQRELYESIRVAAHERVRTVISEHGLEQSTITVLDALMKLRQVCCDPRLIRLDAARQCEVSAKFDYLLEMVTRQLEQGRRILVFSQFANMLALIAQALRERGIKFSFLTGGTQDRQAEVDAFQRGQCDVFLISLKAGGTGLNLTRADTVIHYDPWWNPAAQAQATDRAYRIGQTRPVFVYQLIVSGSVEERMLRLQARKQTLADGLLRGSGFSGLSGSDIENLLAPLSE